MQTRTLAGCKWLDSFDIGDHPGDVEVRIHDSVDEFREIAEPLYRRDPIANTIELTLLAAGAFPDDSLLLTTWSDGTPGGAALQTPPYPLACNAIPIGAAGDVVTELVARRPDLSAVRGDPATAMAFADEWRAITGREASVSTEERLYRLGTLRAPENVTGTARLASGDDRDLLAGWVHWFFADAFGHVRNRDGETFVDNANQVGHQFVLWELEGAPGSMAMLRVPAAGVSRIGPVFTPRDQRGNGYGSAVTAAACALAHRDGTPDVVLFADLANPTSNAIYQRIGFEVVADSVRIDFVTLD